MGTFLRVGFYDQRLAVGPDGTVHLAFVDGAAERVHYGSCQSNCGDPASWSPVQLVSNAQLGVTTVGPYGLAVDQTGRIHMLLSSVTPLGSTANAMLYGTCTANCGNPAGWTFVDLSSLAPNVDTITTSSTFMVEPAGRVSFLTTGQYNGNPSIYFACGSACTTLGNWSAAAVLNGHPLHALQDGQGVTHVMVRLADSGAGDSLLYYARCTTNCSTSSSWELSALGFLHRMQDWASGFAVTAGGRVFMAYNQGDITVSTQDNRKLFINSCLGAGCMDLNTWQSFSLGDLEEGLNGAWLEPDGESMLLATVAGPELRVRTCSTNCGAAAGSWSALSVVDSSAAMNQAFAPDTGSACPGTSESASWWPKGPTAATGPRGAVVVHNPYAIVKCPGDPFPDQLPTIGRVISTY